MNKEVCVIVLSYNREDILKQCISLICQQSFSSFDLLVVDNNSIFDVRKLVESFNNKNIHLTILDENSGPGGGFAEGLKWAVKRDYKYVVLMDDDILLNSKESIQKLVENYEEGVMVYPRVIDRDDQEVTFPGWYAVLLPVNIVKEVGYPRADYFFWAEDTEYLHHRLHRLRKFQYKRVNEITVRHFTTRSPKKPAWKFYYEIRNMIHFRFYVQKHSLYLRLKRLSKSYIKTFGRIILKEDKKWLKLKMFFLGSYHGIIARLGKTVNPEKYS